MPDIFSDRPGTAAVLSAPNSLPTFVSLGGWGPGAVMKGVLVGDAVQAQDGHQVSHSLRDQTWVYSFGPRVVDLTLQGVAFAGVCNGDGSSGVERAYQFFERSKLSAAGTPVKVSLGAYTALKGFLVGFQSGRADPSTGLGAFALQLKCPPRPQFGLPALPGDA